MKKFILFLNMFILCPITVMAMDEPHIPEPKRLTGKNGIRNLFQALCKNDKLELSDKEREFLEPHYKKRDMGSQRTLFDLYKEAEKKFGDDHIKQEFLKLIDKISFSSQEKKDKYKNIFSNPSPGDQRIKGKKT